MQAQEQRYYSPEEYLKLETVTESKSEYYDGQILPMAGGSRNHNRISLNLSSRLNSDLEQYEVFMSDMRLWISQQKLYTYPDVIVIFGQCKFGNNRNDTITNPLMIAEVISESTESYDRGKKFEFYRIIPTLQEYILIDQYRIHIEQFSRTAEDKWLLSEYAGTSAMLSLTSIDFQVPLSVLYRKVEL